MPPRTSAELPFNVELKKTSGRSHKKLQIHQQLEEDDFDRRVEMAQVLLPVLQLPANKKRTFFSDEAVFHVHGLVHKQNCRILGY